MLQSIRQAVSITGSGAYYEIIDIIENDDERSSRDELFILANIADIGVISITSTSYIGGRNIEYDELFSYPNEVSYTLKIVGINGGILPSTANKFMANIGKTDDVYAAVGLSSRGVIDDNTFANKLLKLLAKDIRDTVIVSANRKFGATAINNILHIIRRFGPNKAKHAGIISMDILKSYSNMMYINVREREWDDDDIHVLMDAIKDTGIASEVSILPNGNVLPGAIPPRWPLIEDHIGRFTTLVVRK